MILDKIILENFGVFGGRQEAVLTPEKGKPIILFGGMNGGGKTTLLEAVQLAFYGPKARISNRGRRAYKEYLQDSIHRNTPPEEGSKIAIFFRRVIEGKFHNFELHRSWRVGLKGIEESVQVFRDGLPDQIATEYWDETIEAYLPSSIAHLFFFDGEQIKDLAEGKHSAEILGTAIHSLLGLDLIERLDQDLKVFERKKKRKSLDPEITYKLDQAKGELEEIDRQQERTAMEEGTLVNEAGRLSKEMHDKEKQFREEGGELYLRHKEIEHELTEVVANKQAAEEQLRLLIAGPLPLLFVKDLLVEVEHRVKEEAEIKRARILQDILKTRDKVILAGLHDCKLTPQTLNSISQVLEEDRKTWIERAEEELILDADEALSPQIAHLCGVILPNATQKAQELTATISFLDEKITRLTSMIERVPSSEKIEDLQQELLRYQRNHREKLGELEAVKVRLEALNRQRKMTQARLEKIGESDLDAKFAEEDRMRMLKHSKKVRKTLGELRLKIIKRHTENMESLMLDSLHLLLHKEELINKVIINPQTFEATLIAKDSMPLSLDRLSAGEKQLLATSLLWGLARASGRPVPTIIDTPLGRLDSLHRNHLIQRYFPMASHQVLLLSTDEEIVGNFLEDLKPFISRTYFLSHNDNEGKTNLREGYFNS